MRKLIVIRGNSGSGKSSVAIGIRNKVKGAKKIAIIEQDYFRRFILKEREAESDNNIKLIEKIVKITLDMGYDVILEGILYSKRYGEMIKKIKESVDDFHIYYLDIPFEETLKRHSKKFNKDEFGEKEMKEWYKEKDVLGISNEKIIDENFSEAEIVEKIIKESGI